MLDGVYEINTVILYNQVNYHSEQLSNVNIYVYDFGGKRSLCANTGNMKNVYIKEFKCKAGAIGNVVMLSKSSRGSIRLCEVVVYGDKGKFIRRVFSIDRYRRLTMKLLIVTLCFQQKCLKN